jgi:hypothetical protein
MDSGEALRIVRGLAKANRVRFTAHAAREAVECGATRDDVRCALANAKSVRASGRGRTSDWTVMGPDTDGDDLDIAVVLEDGVPVITVY